MDADVKGSTNLKSEQLTPNSSSSPFEVAIDQVLFCILNLTAEIFKNIFVADLMSPSYPLTDLFTRSHDLFT